MLQLDRATVIRPPAKTAMVVIGNPAIADVSVQKNGVMVADRKTYGETNMIALDDQGQLLSGKLDQGAGPAAQSPGVVRGAETETYSCTPIASPRWSSAILRTSIFARWGRNRVRASARPRARPSSRPALRRVTNRSASRRV